MIQGVEQALLSDRPRVVLVCGDANTNLAAGLAARKLRLVLGHVESGLRSGDWSMPEEHNRIILDHVSELLFAPTRTACRNLERDSVRGEIHLTGNTIVDAVQQNLEIARRKSDVLERLAVGPGTFIICTSHREENVDSRERLERILEGVSAVASATHRDVIFPIHPRTRRRISEFGFDTNCSGDAARVRLIEPLGYLDFLQLLANARMVLTDSGGIQEESCILQVPCVTLRDNTERPETITVGANRIAGVDPDRILAQSLAADSTPRSWPNPFGDGRAAERIIDVVEHVLAHGVALAHHEWEEVEPATPPTSPETP
jgi:UDP-N-acetylglucosamine 2-epimerase (non-hydrolysing)